MDPVILPDGSAFALASYPLPKDHWLYAPREYAPGAEEPVELPVPILTHALREHVVAAVRYAVRGATMCGQEPDFDPDALVQNAVYALCGPYVRVESPAQPIDSPTQLRPANDNTPDWRKQGPAAQVLGLPSREAPKPPPATGGVKAAPDRPAE